MEINNKTFEDYAKILREAVPYNDDITKIQFVTKADKRRRDRIKKFYKEKAGLDLEALENSDLSTWEKTFELAQFVSKLVPHDNQEKWITRLNAISLYKYVKAVQACQCTLLWQDVYAIIESENERAIIA